METTIVYYIGVGGLGYRGHVQRSRLRTPDLLMVIFLRAFRKLGVFLWGVSVMRTVVFGGSVVGSPFFMDLADVIESQMQPSQCQHLLRQTLLVHHMPFIHRPLGGSKNYIPYIDPL